MLVIHSVHINKKPSCGIIKNLNKNDLMWYMVNETQCYELQTKTSDLKLWRFTSNVNRARTICERIESIEMCVINNNNNICHCIQQMRRIHEIGTKSSK